MRFFSKKLFVTCYRLLAIQLNKGVASLCKNYQHYYSCVRTKNVYKFPTKLDFVFANLSI